jgi:hypothetical protein
VLLLAASIARRGRRCCQVGDTRVGGRPVAHLLPQPAAPGSDITSRSSRTPHPQHQSSALTSSSTAGGGAAATTDHRLIRCSPASSSAAASRSRCGRAGCCSVGWKPAALTSLHWVSMAPSCRVSAERPEWGRLAGLSVSGLWERSDKPDDSDGVKFGTPNDSTEIAQPGKVATAVPNRAALIACRSPATSRLRHASLVRSGIIVVMSTVVTTPQSVRGDNPAQFAAILADLRAGRLSYRVIARRHGVGASTVGGIARREGIARPSGQQVAAAALHAGYYRAERVRLLDLAFERVEMLLDDVQDPKSLQQIVAALATLVDRRRLEEDKPTARTEVINHESARRTLAEKLERLVAHSTE